MAMEYEWVRIREKKEESTCQNLRGKKRISFSSALSERNRDDRVRGPRLARERLLNCTRESREKGKAPEGKGALKPKCQVSSNQRRKSHRREKRKQIPLLHVLAEWASAKKGLSEGKRKRKSYNVPC